MQKPGWYSSTDGTDSLRWWDGKNWTDHVAVREGTQPAAPTAGGAVPAAARTRISNRNMLLLIGGAALAIILGVNGIAAAVSSGGSSAPAALASGTPSVTPTPKPTPTGPKVTYQTVLEDEVIPFNRVAKDDPNTAAGTSFVSTPGVDGKYTRTYRVTFHDGVEVGRTLTKEGVSVAPVDEVTVKGTYVAPAPAPAPVADASGGCDPNYADGCVPIASDVDCAGGSGNGPAYFSGTARVVGRDIYDLDRDGNGIACQS